MTKIFVVFKKQSWEKVNSYSLVDDESYKLINGVDIEVSKEVPSQYYSVKDLERLREELLK